jgi:hypothetical protein
MELQGARGAGSREHRRARKTAGVRGITYPPRRTAGGLHFLGGELAELR